jgi:hypothetical protein
MVADQPELGALVVKTVVKNRGAGQRGCGPSPAGNGVAERDDVSEGHAHDPPGRQAQEASRVR